MDRNKLYRKLIETQGRTNQLFMVCEELAELIQAISKYRRKLTSESRQNLIEELADVEIMTDQLMIIAGIDYTEVVDRVYDKLLRTESRLNTDLL